MQTWTYRKYNENTIVLQIWVPKWFANTVLARTSNHKQKSSTKLFMILLRSGKLPVVPHKAVAEVSKIGNL